MGEQVERSARCRGGIPDHLDIGDRFTGLQHLTQEGFGHLSRSRRDVEHVPPRVCLGSMGRGTGFP